MLRLAVDGEDHIEEEGPMGTTWRAEYKEVMSTELFLSASGYEALTGEHVDQNHIEANQSGDVKDRGQPLGGIPVENAYEEDGGHIVLHPHAGHRVHD